MQTLDPVNEPARRVLIIDDDDDILLILKTSLDPEYQTECAKSYSELAKALETFVPDIAVVDINLPGQDGFHCIEKIKEKNQNVLSIAISGMISRDHLFQGIRNKVFDYIEKPFNFELVAKRVDLARKHILLRMHPYGSVEQNLHRIINVGLAAKDVLTNEVNPLLHSVQLLLAEQARRLPVKQENRPVHDLMTQVMRAISDIRTRMHTLMQPFQELQFFYERNSFSAIVGSCLNIFNTTLETLHIDTRQQFDKELFVFCDANEMGQLIVNLLANAINSSLNAHSRWLMLTLDADKQNLYFSLTSSDVQGISGGLRLWILNLLGIKGTERFNATEELCMRLAKKHSGNIQVTRDNVCKKVTLTLPHLN